MLVRVYLDKGRHQKKASFFWTLYKSGLDPPLLPEAPGGRKGFATGV